LNTDEAISLSKINQNINAPYIIVFGFSPKQLGVFANLRNYVFTTINGTAFLFCDNLQAISTQNNLKAALWDALKNELL
jgi:hypothetical protein